MNDSLIEFGVMSRMFWIAWATEISAILNKSIASWQLGAQLTELIFWGLSSLMLCNTSAFPFLLIEHLSVARVGHRYVRS